MNSIDENKKKIFLKNDPSIFLHDSKVQAEALR